MYRAFLELRPKDNCLETADRIKPPYNLHCQSQSGHILMLLFKSVSVSSVDELAKQS